MTRLELLKLIIDLPIEQRRLLFKSEIPIRTGIGIVTRMDVHLFAHAWCAGILNRDGPVTVDDVIAAIRHADRCTHQTNNVEGLERASVLINQDLEDLNLKMRDSK